MAAWRRDSILFAILVGLPLLALGAPAAKHTVAPKPVPAKPKTYPDANLSSDALVKKIFNSLRAHYQPNSAAADEFVKRELEFVRAVDPTFAGPWIDHLMQTLLLIENPTGFCLRKNESTNYCEDGGEAQILIARHLDGLRGLVVQELADVVKNKTDLCFRQDPLTDLFESHREIFKLKYPLGDTALRQAIRTACQETTTERAEPRTPRDMSDMVSKNQEKQAEEKRRKDLHHDQWSQFSAEMQFGQWKDYIGAQVTTPTISRAQLPPPAPAKAESRIIQGAPEEDRYVYDLLELIVPVDMPPPPEVPAKAQPVGERKNPSKPVPVSPKRSSVSVR